MLGRRVGVAFVSSTLILASIAASGSSRPDDGLRVVRLRVGNSDTLLAVHAALLGARRRLEKPPCRRLFLEFRDESGQVLQAQLDAVGHSPTAHLAHLFFYDGEGKPACRDRGVLAATSPHSSVVLVCSASFGHAFKRNRRLAEAILIHELLHTLGLGENPPTSREITDRVLKACR